MLMLINKLKLINRLLLLLLVWLGIIKLSGILYWLVPKSTNLTRWTIIHLAPYYSDSLKNSTVSKTKRYASWLLNCSWKMVLIPIGSFKKLKDSHFYIIFVPPKWKWTKLKNLSMNKSFNSCLIMVQILNKKH